MNKGLIYIFHPEGNEEYGNEVMQIVSNHDFERFMRYYNYDNFSYETGTNKLPDYAMDLETGDDVDITAEENFNMITVVDVE